MKYGTMTNLPPGASTLSGTPYLQTAQEYLEDVDPYTQLQRRRAQLCSEIAALDRLISRISKEPDFLEELAMFRRLGL